MTAEPGHPQGVLIVDDEPPAVERLADIVSGIPGFEVAGCESRPERVLARCEHLQPDVILLDIEMPGTSGLDIAHRLAAGARPPAIVFVTAHDRYAVEAFGVAAVDYVVKPVRPDRLREALRRVTPARPAITRFVAARIGERLIRLPLGDVRAFTAEEGSTLVHSVQGRAVIDEPLKTVEHQYRSDFVRIHRNALVSRYHLRSLYTDDEGVERVSVAGLEHGLEVSRRNRTTVKRLLTESS
ncbi:MAG: LytR/AlgR family response regulator transcription factor [Candidatus Wenzhouxiangella sp. M2_3B_020]